MNQEGSTARTGAPTLTVYLDGKRVELESEFSSGVELYALGGHTIATHDLWCEANDGGDDWLVGLGLLRLQQNDRFYFFPKSING